MNDVPYVGWAANSGPEAEREKRSRPRPRRALSSRPALALV